VSRANGGTDPHDLGFKGLLAAGYTPEEAWHEIRSTSEHPVVRALIAEMRSTEEGRAALDWSRQEWARYGLIPPWDLP
jgi:hypothetical protein